MSLLKRLIAGILVALCLGLPARSAGESGNGAGTDSLYLTLDQLFERGLSCDFSVQNLRLRRQIAEGESRVARNALLPDVQVGAVAGYVGQPVVFRRGLSDPTYPDCPDWSQNYALSLTQPLYQGGRLRQQIRCSKLEAAVASDRLDEGTSDLKLTLLQYYLQLFSLYKERDVLTFSIRESERRLKDIRRLRQEGLITNNDVLRSELQLTNDALSLKETENSIRLVSQQLDLLAGFDERLLIVPDTALLDSSMAIGSYEHYVNLALAAEPGMKAARHQTELARTSDRLLRAEFRPSLSLYAGNTLARPLSRTLEDLYNNNWNVGLTFSYSFSSLYRARQRLQMSRQQIALALNAEQLQLQTLRMRIREAYLRHHEAVDRVNALRLSARQARENYRIMENRYLNQLAILTDLLDANNVLLQVELQLTGARTEVVRTYYLLQRACGQL